MRELAKKGDTLQGLARIHHISGALKAYETTAVFAGGRAEPAGFDVFGKSADRALWIALFAPRAPRPEDQPTVNTAAKAALGGGDTGLPALLSVGVVPALKAPTLFEQVSAPTPVPVLWEMSSRGRNDFETNYLTLGVEPGTDTSKGLAVAGTLRLQLPDESLIWAPSNDVGVNPRAGVGDAPPRLDDPDRAARLIAWIRLRPKPGEQVNQLSLSWLGLNAVEIDQRVTLSGRVLGVSTGAADQVFQLPLPVGRRADPADPGRGAGPRLPALVPRRRSGRHQPATPTSRAKRRPTSSTPRPARCASAMACAGASPSARCACAWRSAGSAAAARAIWPPAA